jgi:hypothetical protein
MVTRFSPSTTVDHGGAAEPRRRDSRIHANRWCKTLIPILKVDTWFREYDERVEWNLTGDYIGGTTRRRQRRTRPHRANSGKKLRVPPIGNSIKRSLVCHPRIKSKPPDPLVESRAVAWASSTTVEPSPTRTLSLSHSEVCSGPARCFVMMDMEGVVMILIPEVRP